MLHVWPRLSRDQDRLLDPATSSHAELAAHWNVAPTDPLPVVRYDRKSGERSLDILRWDLVPYWAKDIKVGFANINAMAGLAW
jgi:putative SOS response-associated peptidase YedK